jgi:eukaryotic-like serine/threonine-protein kinase
MSNLVTLRPKPGDVVERVYHVECELGSDATSAVLGAVVPATGKRYALRCWLDGSGASAAVTTQQFVRVANAARLFEQPGIVETFGVGRTNGVFYSVTEWLEGMTLERYIERRGQLSARDALLLLQPCLEGLAVAHNGGITHGDLRPANVFVCRPTRTEAERARLGKFGCGRWPDKAPEFQRRISNDLYHRQFVSPEELQGQFGDPRSDVYAVGVLLYVMLAGRSPFSSHTSRELDREISTGRWKPLTESIPTLSPSLANVIARAMTLDPDARFQDMGEMVTDLAQVDVEDVSAIEKYAPEATQYRWLTPASKWDDSALFDIPPSAFEEVAARREATSSRILQACLVLSLSLLSATLLHRMIVQPEVPLLSAKQRQLMLARPPSDDTTAALSFDPLLVPAELAPVPEAAAPEGRKAAPQNSAPRVRPVAPPPPTAAAPSKAAAAPQSPASTGQPAKPQEQPAPAPHDAAPSPAPNLPPALLSAPTTGATSSSSAPLSHRHAEVLDHMQLQ